MHDRKLEIIKELMEQLQEEMEYGKDDFEERLGRKKPEVAIMKVEAETPELEEMEESLGEDLDGDDEEGESLSHKQMVFGGGEDPDESLKKRLMKLRA